MTQATPFDILIVGARVIDPASGTDRVMDVGVRAGRIAAMGDLAGCAANDTVDAAGCLLTPGWIDAHIHLWPMVSFGVQPESTCYPSGVTVAVDAGSTGSATYELCRPAMLAMGVTARALLNASPGGLTAMRSYPENINPAQMDRANTLRLLREYPDEIRGMKIRMGRETGLDMGLAPLQAAAEMAAEAGVPLMVHCTHSAVSLGAIADCLKPGDILSHPYHGHGENTMAAGDSLERVKAARARGVYLDVGDASWHISFEIMKLALKEGLAPDSISTDITDRGLYRPGGAFSLPMCAAKWLNLGMPLMEVVRCVTQNPAKMFGMDGEYGALAEGRRADISLFRMEEKPTPLRDGCGQEMIAGLRLRPMMTLKNGRAVFRDTELYQ